MVSVRTSPQWEGSTRSWLLPRTIHGGWSGNFPCSETHSEGSVGKLSPCNALQTGGGHGLKGCRGAGGRAFWDFVKCIMGRYIRGLWQCVRRCKLFKERTIGREKGESRRNKHRKMERNGDKRGWSHVNRSWSVCLSDSVPYHSSLSCVFVKSYFQIQSVWVCSHFWLRMCVCQQPSSWTSPRAWYEVWVPATGGGPQTSGACRCECSNGGRPGVGYCVGCLRPGTGETHMSWVHMIH